MQKIQDWLTQQWVILWGRKIDPETVPWLVGPFGDINGSGEDFITKLAEKEHLVIDRSATGLLPSINSLDLPKEDLSRLSRAVIGFYEQTAHYDLGFTLTWCPFFRIFGVLINTLFSNRINQLNLPARSTKTAEAVQSELIALTDPVSKALKYTIWLRRSKSRGQLIYCGVYGTCCLASGQTAIKAVFPLPNGNATVIMLPRVGPDGALILDASGERFGDAGFYFVLKGGAGQYWSQFIRSFRDRLIVTAQRTDITAEQTLTLWHRRVLQLHYQIRRRERADF